jgi:Ser/Thr protein kinase RdoA (MazF antagonist)
MSGHYLKHYPDPCTRQRTLANYSWLAGLESAVPLPRLLPTSNAEHLMFEHVNGRHASPEDLSILAVQLGDMHGNAYARELHRARLPKQYRTRAGHTLPSFSDRRAGAVARELRAGRVPDARLTAHEAQELIMDAHGPAAFYEDANPRNFLVTPEGSLVTIDFDDLTLAPFGYDLAKLIVTLAMTYGSIPAADIDAALTSYNEAAARHCQSLPGVTREELTGWAEIHHILTSRYATDGRYPYRWNQAWPGLARPHPGRSQFMAVITTLILTRHGEATGNQWLALPARRRRTLARFRDRRAQNALFAVLREGHVLARDART